MDCSIHRGTPVILACGSCNNTPVCSNCIAGDHNGHRFVKPEDLAQNSRDLLATRNSDNKQLITELTSDLDEIKSEKEEQESHSDKVDRLIEAQRLLVHGVVDSIAEDLKKLNHLELERNLEMIKDQEKDVKDQLGLRKAFDSDTTKALGLQDNFHVIKAVKEFSPLTLERLNIIFPNRVEFCKGEVDIRMLQIMFGGVMNTPVDAESGCDFLDSVDGQEMEKRDDSEDRNHPIQGNTVGENEQITGTLRFVSSFQSSSAQVSSIIPSVYGKSWLKCITERKITLVDKQGNKSGTVEFESSVCGITESDDPNVLYACGIALQQIQKISVDKGQVKNMFSTAPMFPCGIAHISFGNLLVIMDSYFFNKRNANASITKYSSKGKVLARCQNKAFGSLGRIRINKSEDTILVTNSRSDRLCYLMLLNSNLKIRMSYFGDGNTLSGEYDLQPETRYKSILLSDVCFDSHDNILICDHISMAVEVLSPTCERLQILAAGDTEIPRAINVNGEDVWIGYKSGKVLIYNN